MTASSADWLIIKTLKTRRADFGERAEVVSLSYGGVTLYAKNQETLDRAITLVQTKVSSLCLAHLILPRVSLNKLIRDQVSTKVDQSLLGAIIGRLLSVGELHQLLCSSVNSRTFGVLVNSNNLARLVQSIQNVEALLTKSGTASAREVQTLLFPGREWGTYASSLFILNHLAYKGRAVFLDKDLFAWPKEIENALR